MLKKKLEKSFMLAEKIEFENSIFLLLDGTHQRDHASFCYILHLKTVLECLNFLNSYFGA
jgi:hypothetical protein